ncbi:hypothetical protein M3P36_04965 [Altererythrobacter sp. KTW20L]|uniref:hypothetical protein n=1 Tax=Altererythrobacter sp. KTW20L TaxID=2942210 RepID=UPI0020C04FE7|nr:hypothetical protein [Altererythrobacter sp. KTW20L]MCL6250400.1 hypothetical protein [Altererythrobacter sp. KTW20L]
MDLKDEAFHASAQALELNLLAYGPEILELEGPERLYLDEHDTRGIRLDVGVGGTFPIMSVEDATFIGRGAKLAIATLDLAIGRLAAARTWKRVGSKGPPAATMKTSELTVAVMEVYGLEAQGLVDSTWQTTTMHERYDDLVHWRSRSEVPRLLRRTVGKGYEFRDLPEVAPWVAGYCSQSSINVEAVSLGEEAAIYWRPQDHQRFEVRLASGIPETVANAMTGKPLSEIVDHPLARRFDGIVENVSRLKNSIRLSILREASRRFVQLDIDESVLAMLQAEKSKLRVGQARIQLLMQRQLTPPDVDINVEPAVLELIKGSSRAKR